jgi:hypothetical protein
MSNIPLISRHKAFAFQGTVGAGASSVNTAGCEPSGEDRVSFIRMGQTGAGAICPINIPSSGFEATLITEIGDTEYRPFGSGMAYSEGLDAQIHAANANLTLSNRGCRARYDYYFWQGRDIWRYDSRIETSGSRDTFSQWTIDATPISTLVNGTTLGLYPMLLGSGNLTKQAPYLCTVAFDGTDVVRIKKNLITGVWSSGSIGTLSAPGVNGIPIAEVFHNNSIYFITDQDDKVGVVNFDFDGFQELTWPEEVRHPMDLNVFRGSVYCLNKTATDSGVAVWSVDSVLGMNKAVVLGTDLGADMANNNFRGRNMLFTCTAQNVITGSKPHMVAFNWVGAEVDPSGIGGVEVWMVAETGNGNLAVINDQTGKNPTLLADEWALGSAGLIFRPTDGATFVEKSEDVMWRPWVNDRDIAVSGNEIIKIIFRENSEDGAVWRQYRYRNTPNEDKMTLEGGYAQEGVGKSAHSYATPRFGGGHYDGTAWIYDVIVSGVEDLPSGKTRVWYIVDGDYLYDDGHEIKVTLRYGGQATNLSTPHKNLATIDGTSDGTIVNSELFTTIASGQANYVDWNTIGDGLVHRSKTNFAMYVDTTGTAPDVAPIRKMSPVVYAAINAEPFTYPTGPTTHSIFQNIAQETYSTGPSAYDRLTQDRVLDFTVSTGPQVYGMLINVGDDTFSTGPSTPIASGLWSLPSPPASGTLTRPVIWWGFRTPKGRISGFGRPQGTRPYDV